MAARNNVRRMKNACLDARYALLAVRKQLIKEYEQAMIEYRTSCRQYQAAKEQLAYAEEAASRYELHAELIGYMPYKKVHDISQAPGWDLDLGTIGMEESTEQIDASSITAAGNPITIQNDTVIYHASSYTVGENAMTFRMSSIGGIPMALEARN